MFALFIFQTKSSDGPNNVIHTPKSKGDQSVIVPIGGEGGLLPTAPAL